MVAPGKGIMIKLADATSSWDATDHRGDLFSTALSRVLGRCHCLGKDRFWYCSPGLLINRSRSETRQESQGKLYWGSCCSRKEQEQVAGPLAHSLKAVRLGVGSWAGLEGWLSPPLWWCCLQPHAEVAVGFLFFGLFVSYRP